MTTHCWLGLDSSIAAFGFAVMHRNSIYGSTILTRAGVWLTKIDHEAKKLDDRARRVADLGDRLLETIEKEHPTEAYIEDLALGMKTGRGTAQTLGRMRGLVEGICRARGIELAAIRPDVLKRACTGRRDASKEDVRDVVSKLYGIKPGADLNATDAVACAHVGAQRFIHGLELKSGVVRYAPPEDQLDVD